MYSRLFEAKHCHESSKNFTHELFAKTLITTTGLDNVKSFDKLE